MQIDHGRRFDGWRPDAIRASIVSVFYVGGLWAGLSHSFLYGGGFAGYFPFLLGLFGGPWAAAWATCKVLPSSRPLLVRLALGIYAGLLMFLIVGNVVSALTPQWRLGDPPPRLTENGEAILVVASLLLCLLASTTMFSRWRATPPPSTPLPQ